MLNLKRDLKTSCQDALNEGVDTTEIIDRMVDAVASVYFDVSKSEIRRLAEGVYTEVTGKSAPQFLAENF